MIDYAKAIDTVKRWIIVDSRNLPSLFRRNGSGSFAGVLSAKPEA